MADPKSPAADPGGAERKAKILELAERTNVKFMRLQFTDILGVIKNVEIPQPPVRRGAGRPDHVRRLVDRGLRPDRGVGHVPAARPVDLPGPAGDAEHRRADRPADLRHPQPGRQPVRGLPAPRAQARHRPRREDRLHDELRPRGRVLPVPDPGRQADHRDPRRGRLLRPRAGRSRRGRAPADRAGARVDGHRRRGGAPRGRRRPARDRLPPGRRARHRRQRQHLPLHRQERRAAERPARHLHAEAGLRPQRLRAAPAPVALRPPTAERVPRRRRAVAIEPRVPQLHRRPAAPRARASARSPTRW